MTRDIEKIAKAEFLSKSLQKEIDRLNTRDAVDSYGRERW